MRQTHWFVLALAAPSLALRLSPLRCLLPPAALRLWRPAAVRMEDGAAALGMMESMLVRVGEQGGESGVVLSEAWDEVDALELDLARQLGLETVEELEELMEEYNADSIDELSLALDAVLAAADEEAAREGAAAPEPS